MYLPLILFIASLLGVSAMLLKRVHVLQLPEEYTNSTKKDSKEIHVLAINKIKDCGYLMLVNIIRIYLKTNRLLKRIYVRIVNALQKAKNKYITKRKKKGATKSEASGFLTKVAEYKNKVKEIKEKIQEEDLK